MSDATAARSLPADVAGEVCDAGGAVGVIRAGDGVGHGAHLFYSAAARVSHGHQAVRDGLGQHGLHVVRRHVVAPADERLGLGCAHQGNACARRETLQEPAARPRGCDQVLHIVEQRVGRVDGLHLALQLGQFVVRQHGQHAVHHVPPVGACQQHALGCAVGVADGDAHQEPVQLRFRQCKGAQLVVRVLRGNHKEGVREGAGFAFDRHLFFFHGFEQRALRLGAGTVDFVGQQHLGEHGARVEHKGLLAALVHRHPREVAGHQVGRELHARELQAKGARQGVGQGGFPHPRDVFDEQVPAGQQAGHAVLYLGLFAHDHRVKLIQ